VDYLEASAAGGYLMALMMVLHLEQEYPERLGCVVEGLPALDAVAAYVELGPRYNLRLWLMCCSFLRGRCPEKYHKSIEKLRLSGFSELGESEPPGGPGVDLSFRGPDVRYLWIAEDTIDVFQKFLGIAAVDDLIFAFESGRFPSDGRNQYGETALYICCRSGHGKMTQALLSSFGWAVEQANIPNLNGRLPLHWLYQFEEELVEEIGDALLKVNEAADIFAIDDAGFRAIDYAIGSGRHDVAIYLLSKRKYLQTSQTYSNIG
jgi:ankyrin repeat protein